MKNQLNNARIAAKSYFVFELLQKVFFIRASHSLNFEYLRNNRPGKMKFALIMLLLIFFPGPLIAQSGKSKNPEIGNYAYSEIDPVTKKNVFYTLSKVESGQVKITRHFYNPEMIKESENSETMEISAAKQKYPWWNYEGDLLSIDKKIDLYESKVRIVFDYSYYDVDRVKFELYRKESKYDWKKYTYTESKEQEKVVEPENFEGKSYNHIFLKIDDSKKNSITAFVSRDGKGLDFIKVNDDLTYTTKPYYIYIEKPYYDKVIQDKSTGNFYLMGSRTKKTIPKGVSIQNQEGYFLLLVDKDGNLKKEVQIKEDTVENITEVWNKIIVSASKNTYIFDPDLNLIEKKENFICPFGWIIYKSEDYAITIHKTDKIQVMKLFDKNLDWKDTCWLPGEELVMMETANFNNKDYFVAGVLIRRPLTKEFNYCLIKAENNTINLKNILKYDKITIPDGDKAQSKLGSSNGTLIQEVFVKNKFYTKSNNLVMTTYFYVWNTKAYFNNFARLLIIDPQENMYCFEVFGMYPSRPLIQKVYDYGDQLLWAAIGNSSLTPFTDTREAKLSVIDMQSKKMIKHKHVENINLDMSRPFIQMSDANSIGIVAEDGKTSIITIK